jgi:hypothetical protein
MSDVLAAAFLAIAVAWIANKWSSGDVTFGGSSVSALRGDGSENEKPAESNYPKTFGAWATRALVEFAETEKEVLDGGSTAEGLRSLYVVRGSIMENFYARKRYAPNDDELLSRMDGEAEDADRYMTSAINRARSKNRDLRFVRYPLSCGDGDALFPVTA